jgi:hypothetical protein
MTADIIALPTADLITDPATIAGLPGTSISVQAHAGHVCIETLNGEAVDVHLTIQATLRLIQALQSACDDAVRMASSPARKPSIWAAPAATQQAYATRLEAARKAFTALDTDTQSRVSVLLERMGTSAAPCGTTQFAGIVQMLAGYGIREADQLFAADLRAIGRMG